MSENERRTIEIGNDIRHCECFAGTRNAEQSLFGESPVDSVSQFGYRLRLIAHGFVLGMKNKFIHIDILYINNGANFLTCAIEKMSSSVYMRWSSRWTFTP